MPLVVLPGVGRGDGAGDRLGGGPGARFLEGRGVERVPAPAFEEAPAPPLPGVKAEHHGMRSGVPAEPGDPGRAVAPERQVGRAPPRNPAGSVPTAVPPQVVAAGLESRDRPAHPFGPPAERSGIDDQPHAAISSTARRISPAEIAVRHRVPMRQFRW